MGNAGLAQAVEEALQEVFDPELPTVSVKDLGMVQSVSVDEGGAVTVVMMPTFVGCPALSIIERRVQDRVSRVEGVSLITVRFSLDEVWTSERISSNAKEKLKEFGIAPPPCILRERSVADWEVACPYCGSGKTRVENLFGPTACRSLFYCDDCRQPFEVMKPI